MKFSGRQFPKDVILQAIRWYVSYPLSFRMIEEMFAERGMVFDHSTINRWVVAYAAKLEALHLHEQPEQLELRTKLKIRHDSSHEK